MQWILLRQNEKGPKEATDALSGRFQRLAVRPSPVPAVQEHATGGLGSLNGRAPAGRESQHGQKAPYPSSCDRTNDTGPSTKVSLVARTSICHPVQYSSPRPGR